MDRRTPLLPSWWISTASQRVAKLAKALCQDGNHDGAAVSALIFGALRVAAISMESVRVCSATDPLALCHHRGRRGACWRFRADDSAAPWSRTTPIEGALAVPSFPSLGRARAAAFDRG
jgi:hypothetical protein